MSSLSWLVRVLALSSISIFFSVPAAAQAPILSGLGGPEDYGTSCLSPNDDGSSASVDIRTAFPGGLRFFEPTPHTRIYVNTNGNISFGDSLSDFTPDAFPLSGSIFFDPPPMIAPFWADVDIRMIDGMCMGGAGSGGGSGPCLDPTDNGVWWHQEPGLFVATWDDVGYFSCAVDKLATFQLILSTPADDEESCVAGGDFDVEFRYNKCEWHTGNASGGEGGLCGSSGTCTPAQAGFDAGNSMDFVEIAGSRTETIHTILCTESNVGEPGVWRYQIRAGAVVCPMAGETCNTGLFGACADGATQCSGDSTICQQLVTPSAERCDQVDNDCDGMVDEGDAICGALAACESGVCVKVCFEGGCAEGQVCDDNERCVDEGCENVTCAAGERCVDGVCGDACLGVDCPGDQVCRSGQCVDICSEISCDDCSICSEDSCIPKCTDTTDCASGEACTADGACVEAACASVSCPTSQECVGGACQDVCLAATCPPGEMCTGGQCNPILTEMPGGNDAGTPPPPGGEDAGTRPRGDAGEICPVGFVCDDPTPPMPIDRGCGCSIPGATPRGGLGLLLGLGVVGLIAFRRR